MDLSFNYKVLVAEEFCLVNYELTVLLKKRGLTVIEGQETGSPDFVITSLSALKKSKGKEKILSSLLLNNPKPESTDTIVFDRDMKPLAIYPKPYNSNDIVSFIIQHLNHNLIPNHHESND